MKQAKGQGISLNVIIIAVIALIVLIVLISIFTGRINIFGKDIEQQAQGSACTSLGATWEFPTDCKEAIYGKFSDASANPGKVCCKTK